MSDIDFINNYIESSNNLNTIDTNNISDTYHTFGELYEYRMLYNALIINEFAKNNKYNVFKSKRHNDGELCFDGNYFIVGIELPTGLVDNHYEIEYWDLFKCPEYSKSPYKFDNHTPQDVANRLLKFLKGEY